MFLYFHYCFQLFLAFIYVTYTTQGYFLIVGFQRGRHAFNLFGYIYYFCRPNDDLC